MSMWFFDEMEESGEYLRLREEALQCEREYLEGMRALQEAERELGNHPDRRDLRLRVEEVRRRLAEMEARCRWISSDVPMEMALWAPPHG